MKSWQIHGLICLAVAGLTLICMGRVVANDFINLDDPTYVYRNPEVLAGLNWPGAKWAFTKTHAGFWMPLTWLSLQLDATLYWSGPPGLISASAAAWGFHLTNLLLHVANTLLTYWLIFRLTGRSGIAACVAALFGIHPLHVESVAWITERKDVLSAFFGLLALLAYVSYQEKPGFARMSAVVLPFALSLMAKPVLVTLPGVMLLLDWWRRRQFGPVSWTWIVLEKLPLFGLSLLCTCITVLSQRDAQAVADLERLSLYVRLANAVVSYQTYLMKTFWPLDLGVFYPFPELNRQSDDSLSAWNAGLATTILAAICVLAFLLRKTIPAVPVGWLWFLGALLPNIGLVQAGNQAMADRFSYFALLGLFLALVSAGDGLVSLLGVRNSVKIALFAPFVVAFGLLTWVQVGYWRDSRTLYEHTLAVTRNNTYIHAFLGNELYDRGDWEGAEEHLAQYAAGRRGGFAEFQYLYGDLLLRRYLTTDRNDPTLPEKAAFHLSEAVRLNPNNAVAYYKLALVSDYDEARKLLQEGITRTRDPNLLQLMREHLKRLPEATR